MSEPARGVASVGPRPEPLRQLLVAPARRGSDELWLHLCGAVANIPAGAPSVLVQQTECDDCPHPGNWQRLYAQPRTDHPGTVTS